MNMNAVILTPDVPEELSALFHGYIQKHDPPFLASLSFEQEGYFVSLDIIKNTEHKKPWRVKVPIQYVLFVAELTGDQSSPIGFL